MILTQSGQRKNKKKHAQKSRDIVNHCQVGDTSSCCFMNPCCADVHEKTKISNYIEFITCSLFVAQYDYLPVDRAFLLALVLHHVCDDRQLKSLPNHRGPIINILNFMPMRIYYKPLLSKSLILTAGAAFSLHFPFFYDVNVSVREHLSSHHHLLPMFKTTYLFQVWPSEHEASPLLCLRK